LRKGAIVSTTDAKRYVEALDLPAVLRGMEGLESAAPEFTDKHEAVAIGSQLAEFSERVSPAQRAAVADCLLLAQLAANKATEQSSDVMAWYAKYVEVLQNIGWTVQGMNLEDQAIRSIDTHVHNAIIPVLTAMLAPAVKAASLVVKVLEGLQEIDRSSPWITLFSRASQHASGSKFQLGFVDAGPGGVSDVQVQLVASAVNTEGSITQVLFFKLAGHSAKLLIGETKLAIASTRLDAIKGPVSARVEPFLATSIASIDI
jgi:hypothetical protein